jgi:hypothetical protein
MMWGSWAKLPGMDVIFYVNLAPSHNIEKLVLGRRNKIKFGLLYVGDFKRLNHSR